MFLRQHLGPGVHWQGWGIWARSSGTQCFGCHWGHPPAEHPQDIPAQVTEDADRVGGTWWQDYGIWHLGVLTEMPLGFQGTRQNLTWESYWTEGHKGGFHLEVTLSESPATHPWDSTWVLGSMGWGAQGFGIPIMLPLELGAQGLGIVLLESHWNW